MSRIHINRQIASSGGGSARMPPRGKQDPQLVKEYSEYLKKGRNEWEIPVFKVPLFGTDYNVSIIIEKKNGIPDKHSELYRVVLGEWGCTECAVRVSSMSRFVDKNGLTPVCSLSLGRTRTRREIYDLCNSLILDYIQETGGLKWNYRFVTENTMHHARPNTTKKVKGEPEIRSYPHYSFKPSSNNIHINSSAGIRSLSMLNRALDKYCPLLITLFDKMETNEDTLLSFKTLLGIIVAASYGIQILAATKWIIKHIERIVDKGISWRALRWIEKVDIVITAVCDSPISQDTNNDVLCGYFHTISGNVLSLLQTGVSERAVIRMVETRNAPKNYKQTTAPPKAVHVEAARKLFKGLTTIIHTTDELEKLPGCVTVSKNSDVDDAFASMSHGGKKKSCNSFAKRIYKPEIHPKNIRELIELIRSGIVKNLEIMMETPQTVYTARVEGDNITGGDFCVPHLWAYKTESFTRFEDGYNPITHVYRVKTATRENYHFIVEGARRTLLKNPLTGNCTLAEFLSTKHQKTSGTAFHALTNLTTVGIPERGELSIGFGTSVDKANTLTSDVNVRINGKHFKITESGY